MANERGTHIWQSSWEGHLLHPTPYNFRWWKWCPRVPPMRNFHTNRWPATRLIIPLTSPPPTSRYIQPWVRGPSFEFQMSEPRDSRYYIFQLHESFRKNKLNVHSPWIRIWNWFYSLLKYSIICSNWAKPAFASLYHNLFESALSSLWQ
jgi:hypothetical protein